MEEPSLGMTRRLARFVAETRGDLIPGEAYEHAKVALMDWLAVTMAGKDEPLVAKLIAYADLLGGKEQATVLGHGIKKNVSQAALINGAASHALDYDDTLMSFMGHPSVTLFPGVFALGEWKRKSGADLLASYLVGLKVGVSVGSCAGLDHYLAGFHGTATMGVLAAGAACSRLLELDEQQTVYCLGIAGTQSAGLKRVFGTMCKPFQAGRASEVGVMAALLAADGFTSAEDILEGPSGLFQAMRGAVKEEVLASLGRTWEIENVAQKYHASCHGTHSAIEAALSVFHKEGLSVHDIRAIRVHTSQTALSAAFRTEAHTGLEGKFSIPYCVANALLRGDTGLQAFTDEKVASPDVQALMERISTHVETGMTAMEARVEVETTAGKVHSAFSDIFNEIPDLPVKRKKIENKFLDLCEPVLGGERTRRLIEAIGSFERLDPVRTFLEVLAE